MYRLAVRRRSDLSERILPFFEEHPLVTAKRNDFVRFVEVVRLMEIGTHLSVDSLTRIATICESMNFRKPSRFLESSEAIRQPLGFDD
jgi:hypothetical protein